MNEYHTVNYKTLVKVMKKTHKHVKIYCNQGLRELILLKCP